MPKYRLVLFGWGEENEEIDPMNISRSFAKEIHIGTIISEELLYSLDRFLEDFNSDFLAIIGREVQNNKRWYVERIEAIDNFEYSNVIYFDYILNTLNGNKP